MGTEATVRSAATEPPVRRWTGGAEVEELFSRQPSPGISLPDPEPLVLNLTRCAIEVLAGARDLEQIARWLEPEVRAKLAKRAILSARARTATRRSAARPTMSIGSCRIASPADGVVEAVVVVHMPARSRAVTLRLIGVDGRWRASELAVL